MTIKKIIRKIFGLITSNKKRKNIKQSIEKYYKSNDKKIDYEISVNALIVNSGLSNGFSPLLFKVAKNNILENKEKYDNRTINNANKESDKHIDLIIDQYNTKTRNKTGDRSRNTTSNSNRSSGECVSKYF